MKHTPGPWTIERLKNDQWRIQSHDRIICWESLRGTPESKIIDEIEANARLIAATPDLLAACQYVVDWHREHDSGDGELYDLDFVTTCINAIAKATKEDVN